MILGRLQAAARGACVGRRCAHEGWLARSREGEAASSTGGASAPIDTRVLSLNLRREKGSRRAQLHFGSAEVIEPALHRRHRGNAARQPGRRGAAKFRRDWPDKGISAVATFFAWD